MAGKPYAYTQRETRLMLAGREYGIPYKIMAERFGRAPGTIRTHLYRYRKRALQGALGQPKAEKAYEAGPTYLDPATAV